MNFHSPTTTQKDHRTANILAALADLDIDTFADEMFAVTADTSGRSLPEMITQDMKIYDIRSCKLSISQVMVPSVGHFREDSAEIQNSVDTFAKKKQLDLSIVVFTSIMDNGSIVYAGGNRAPWILEAFPDRDGEEHSLQEGLLSRKLQILPKVTQVIESYD